MLPEVLQPPRLSVIVALPAWPPGQHRAGAERVLQSILSQPDPISTEAVIAEDGSSDETLDYFKSAFPDAWRAGRIQIPNLPRLLDGGKIRNAAALAARGTFIAFASSNTRWSPDRLSRLAGALDAHDLILGVSERVTTGDWTRLLIDQNIIVPGSLVIRRTLLDTLGGYPVGTSGTPLLRGLPATPEYEVALRAARELVSLGRGSRIVALERPGIIDESPQLPPEIAGLERRLRSLRDGLAVVRVFRALPKRYWLEALRALGQRGRNLLKGK